MACDLWKGSGNYGTEKGGCRRGSNLYRLEAAVIDGPHCSMPDLFLNFPLEEQRKYTSAFSYVVCE